MNLRKSTAVGLLYPGSLESLDTNFFCETILILIYIIVRLISDKLSFKKYHNCLSFKWF